ncbi:histone family protein DNA-binding protein [Emticicia oligotrophica DSM 17448]|uniref:Histone family protein DNA-binding protein n=1 Tax=Emticicia oligotrophica (strain DSM 17448 / CIP 109782 / MTCC 6937 / GPTSA100-15) TaxID=929562 RepID=A0ABM5N1Y8_EMTOG|nr:MULTISPECIES: HU family DNA-binding protein [Emticicia]AFK03378.1 histone family protein DNA-binding protein [Emticicia oligotrophica DSM 17448]
MTKAEVIVAIADKTGVDKASVSTTIESFFEIVKDTLAKGDAVYVRGFGSFVNKHRAAKKARNISAKTTVMVPAHSVPGFKPSKEFTEQVKASVK